MGGQGLAATSPPAATLTVAAALGDHAPAWDELVAASPLASPFLLSWWLDATVGEVPRFVLVCEREELLGGVALEEDHRFGGRRLRFAGTGPLCPDHLDIVCRTGREQTVAAAVRRWLGRAGQLIDLVGAPEGSHVSGVLPGVVHGQTVSVAPWAALDGSFERYLAARPSRLRHTLQRCQRRLEAGGVTHRLVPVADLDEALRRFRELHIGQWGTKSGLIQRWDNFSRAIRRGAACGQVAVHQLIREGRVVASSAWFEAAQRASYYQAGRIVDDPSLRGAGTVLMAEAVRRACQLGYREIDLLRGDEAYKRDWTTETRSLVRLQTATGLAPRAALSAEVSLMRLRRAKGRWFTPATAPGS